jgi:hypothetical protein
VFKDDVSFLALTLRNYSQFVTYLLGLDIQTTFVTLPLRTTEQFLRSLSTAYLEASRLDYVRPL